MNHPLFASFLCMILGTLGCSIGDFILHSLTASMRKREEKNDSLVTNLVCLAGLLMQSRRFPSHDVSSTLAFSAFFPCASLQTAGPAREPSSTHHVFPWSMSDCFMMLTGLLALLVTVRRCLGFVVGPDCHDDSPGPNHSLIAMSKSTLTPMDVSL